METNIKEIEKKNEFINSIDKCLIENNIKTSGAIKEMNEINIQAKKNMEELSRLLWIKMVKPKCAICGKEMENAIDSKTKQLSKYLWKTTCEHNKNLVLARG